MNAIHFANSLEDEKSLLDDSSEVLESMFLLLHFSTNSSCSWLIVLVTTIENLALTRKSKKQLSTVSKKGRGTTCLTLGVVIFVMVVFVWTYLLIRFT